LVVSKSSPFREEVKVVPHKIFEIPTTTANKDLTDYWKGLTELIRLLIAGLLIVFLIRITGLIILTIVHIIFPIIFGLIFSLIAFYFFFLTLSFAFDSIFSASSPFLWRVLIFVYMLFWLGIELLFFFAPLVGIYTEIISPIRKVGFWNYLVESEEESKQTNSSFPSYDEGTYSSSSSEEEKDRAKYHGQCAEQFSQEYRESGGSRSNQRY
jgi:hypothetical protein